MKKILWLHCILAFLLLAGISISGDAGARAKPVFLKNTRTTDLLSSRQGPIKAWTRVCRPLPQASTGL